MSPDTPTDRGALAASFTAAGSDYDRYRPSFPDAALDLFLTGAQRDVLDLGAGTGKLTERLIGRVPHVTAIDPAESMLAILRSKLPSVETILGTAEDIPAPDASQDVVTVAQAFHWFDRDRAADEIARVLRPGGALALLWNRGHPDCAFEAAAHAVAHPTVHRDPEADRRAPSASPLPGFTAVTAQYVDWREHITRADYLARWLTVSSFLAAAPDVRERMIADVGRILDADPATGGQEAFALPMRTLVLVYRRD